MTHTVHCVCEEFYAYVDSAEEKATRTCEPTKLILSQKLRACGSKNAHEIITGLAGVVAMLVQALDEHFDKADQASLRWENNE